MITNFRRARSTIANRQSAIHADGAELPVSGCDCADCQFARDAELDQVNNPIGCGPWLLLAVGYIVTLTAIGISLIVISTELAR